MTRLMLWIQLPAALARALVWAVVCVALTLLPAPVWAQASPFLTGAAPREAGSAERKGFGPADAIYLVTPDRFANGNPANDNAAGYRERADRASLATATAARGRSTD